MIIIGITGGVGSGKTKVLGYLETEFHAMVYQADLIAHDLQNPGQPCYQQIVSYFGKQILTAEGTIDRQKLGAIVFKDSNELFQLNAIVHPAVKDTIKRYIRIEQNKDTKLFVLEAALLIEEDYDMICDELWYIYAEESVRRKRLISSRHYSDQQIDSMIRAQQSDVVFRGRCNRIIDNSTTFQQTKKQIEEALYEIM